MKHFLCHIFLFLLSGIAGIDTLAQTYLPQDSSKNPSCINTYDSPEIKIKKHGDFNLASWCKEKEVFSSMDVGISLGSMGLGVSFTSPVTKWTNIRAGIDWLPKFQLPLYFSLDTYTDGMATGNFNNVAQMLYDQTGIEMDETVKMNGVGAMLNFKFIVDVFPIPSNRHWHISAGFYAGTSKIGKAFNDYDEKPTLVALNIYNRAYEYFTNLESIYDVPLGGGNYMDPELVEKLQERFHKYGRLGIHIGDFKDGTPYIMEPSPEGSVSAKAFVNHFKPYLGTGYSTHLDKSQRWKFALDLGVLFWGGEPDVINHDYTNNRDISFTHDLINLRGKVHNYMKTIKSFPVYPVLEIRFSYNIL